MLTIRPETPADYAAVHNMLLRAFDYRFGEAALVALLRTKAVYNPDLSLIAEIDRRIVGHVLFMPIQVYLHEQVINLVNLAPLAVHPDFHRQGIGGKLVEHGHGILRDMDYEASVLLGHPTYYPRFGYRTKAYGASSVSVTTASLPEIELQTEKPMPEDIPYLSELHKVNEQHVNLSIVPPASYDEWLSPHPAIPCVVYRHEGEIVGYTRGSREDVRLFLAKDDAMARAIAKNLAGDAATITLPLHPNSSCASAFDEQPTVNSWEAAMLCPLRDDSPVWDYLTNIEDGSLVGRVVWSSAFDIA